jgi:hypothetical protein
VFTYSFEDSKKKIPSLPVANPLIFNSILFYVKINYMEGACCGILG